VRIKGRKGRKGDKEGGRGKKTKKRETGRRREKIKRSRG
jgi:hypothetical protein